MMQFDELIASIDELRREDLDEWLAEALVSSQQANEGTVFSDAECARVRLICTLRYDLDVETDTLPLVMQLIDELHATRQRLRQLSGAVMTQDEAVQETVVRLLRQRWEDEA